MTYFTVTLEATRDPIPADQRLARALKRLWRDHKLKCIAISTRTTPEGRTVSVGPTAAPEGEKPLSVAGAAAVGAVDLTPHDPWQTTQISTKPNGR